MRQLVAVVLVFTGILSFSGRILAAQASTGTILGNVADGTGGVVPNAQVTVRNTAINRSRTGLTDEIGDFLVLSLQPGSYEVTIEKLGFKKFVHSGLSLQVNQRLRVDAILEVGAPDESITILADASVIQADSSSTGVVIAEKEVIELPLNGRDFYQLTYLVPGAAPQAEGSQLDFQGGAVTLFGLREQMNNFLLDGVDNNDAFTVQRTVSPPLDSVQEFKVQSGIYRAEFGTHAGGQINFVTRSGSNRFNFSIYEFHRNAALDAKNFFDFPDRGIPKFIRNQFGISAGGPIARDQTFFFVNYEGLRQRKAQTRRAAVPTSEFIRGDFSSLSVPIFQPGTTQPFPNNMIPPSAMDATGLLIAQTFPEANTPEGDLLSQLVQSINTDQWVVRFDHEFRQADDFFFRYAFFDRDHVSPFRRALGGSNLEMITAIPGFGNSGSDRGQNVALGWTHLFSASIVNDLRIGFNRRFVPTFHENVGNDISSQFGISGLSRDPKLVGFPATIVIGFDPLEEAFFDSSAVWDNTYQLTEAVSWEWGGHSLKLGTDVRHIRQSAFVPLFARGRFLFTGAFTAGSPRATPPTPAHAVADLLLGRPLLVLAGLGDPRASVRNRSYGLYLQDDFKFRPNLTLNIGLRYEYSQPPFEVSSRFTVPDLLAKEASFITCGTRSIPRGCFERDQTNLAPRLGIAWRPFPKRRLVIRAGYGIFYDTGTFQQFLLALNPPNFEVLQIAQPSSIANFQDGFNLPSNVFSVAPHLNLANAQNWTLNIQQGLSTDLLLEVGYRGSKGTHLEAASNSNQPLVPLGPRPFPAYGNISTIEQVASSTYHGLWFRIEKRMSQGLSFRSSYTFAKSIDDSSSLFGSNASNSTPQNSSDRGAERALSDHDLRHRFVFNYIWEVPLGRGRGRLNHLGKALEGILGGWQLSGIWTLQSARPFTAILGLLDGSRTRSRNDRPNLVGNPHLPDPDPFGWFDQSAFELTCDFSQPSTEECPGGTFGNAGRNILRGPGFSSLDFALMKAWRLSESSRLQFRAEVFNLFNHPNFDLPENNVTSAAFGRIQSAKDSRQIQFGFRLDF